MSNSPFWSSNNGTWGGYKAWDGGNQSWDDFKKQEDDMLRGGGGSSDNGSSVSSGCDSPKDLENCKKYLSSPKNDCKESLYSKCPVIDKDNPMTWPQECTTDQSCMYYANQCACDIFSPKCTYKIVGKDANNHNISKGFCEFKISNQTYGAGLNLPSVHKSVIRKV
jgi:hypothetical protein